MAIVDYLSGLLETRNPHIQSDMNIFSIIDKYRGSRDSLYVHMSNTWEDSRGQQSTMIGINPTKRYNNPRGVYVYPFFHFSNTDGSVEFKRNSQNVYIIKAVNTNKRKIKKINKMTAVEYNRCLNAIREWLEPHYIGMQKNKYAPNSRVYFDEIFWRAEQENKNKNNGGRLFYFIVYLTDNMKDLDYDVKVVNPDTMQSKIWYNILGYDYIGDEDGRSIIHENEPYQGVFLSPKAYEVVELVNPKRTTNLKPEKNAISNAIQEYGRDINRNFIKNIHNNGSIIDAYTISVAIKTGLNDDAFLYLINNYDGKISTSVFGDAMNKHRYISNGIIHKLIDITDFHESSDVGDYIKGILMRGDMSIYKRLNELLGQISPSRFSDDSVRLATMSGNIKMVDEVLKMLGKSDVLYTSEMLSTALASNNVGVIERIVEHGLSENSQFYTHYLNNLFTSKIPSELLEKVMNLFPRGIEFEPGSRQNYINNEFVVNYSDRPDLIKRAIDEFGYRRNDKYVNDDRMTTTTRDLTFMLQNKNLMNLFPSYVGLDNIGNFGIMNAVVRDAPKEFYPIYGQAFTNEDDKNMFVKLIDRRISPTNPDLAQEYIAAFRG